MSDVMIKEYRYEAATFTSYSVRVDDATAVRVDLHDDGRRLVGVSHDPSKGRRGSKPPVMYEVGQEPSAYASTVQAILAHIDSK
ncbi:hypothetical protein D1872_51290 [compost metagenome]